MEKENVGLKLAGLKSLGSLRLEKVAFSFNSLLSSFSHFLFKRVTEILVMIWIIWFEKIIQIFLFFFTNFANRTH